MINVLDALRAADPAPPEWELPSALAADEIAARVDRSSRGWALPPGTRRVVGLGPGWVAVSAAAVLAALIGLVSTLDLPTSSGAGSVTDAGADVGSERLADEVGTRSAGAPLVPTGPSGQPLDTAEIHRLLAAGIGGGDIDAALQAWAPGADVFALEPAPLLPWAFESSWLESVSDWTGDGAVDDRDRLAWMLGGLAAQRTQADLSCDPVATETVTCVADLGSAFMSEASGHAVSLVFELDDAQRIRSVAFDVGVGDPMESVRLAAYMSWLAETFPGASALVTSESLKITPETVPVHRRLVAEWVAVRDASLSTHPEDVLEAFYLAMQAGDIEDALNRLDPDIAEYLNLEEWRNMLEFRAAFWPEPSPLVVGDCGYLGFGSLYRCDVAMEGPLTGVLNTTSQVIVADIRGGRIVSFDEQELLFSVEPSFADEAAAADPDGYAASCRDTRSATSRTLNGVTYNGACGAFLFEFAESQGRFGR